MASILDERSDAFTNKQSFEHHIIAWGNRFIELGGLEYLITTLCHSELLKRNDTSARLTIDNSEIGNTLQLMKLIASFIASKKLASHVFSIQSTIETCCQHHKVIFLLFDALDAFFAYINTDVSVESDVLMDKKSLIKRNRQKTRQAHFNQLFSSGVKNSTLLSVNTSGGVVSEEEEELSQEQRFVNGTEGTNLRTIEYIFVLANSFVDILPSITDDFFLIPNLSALFEQYLLRCRKSQVRGVFADGISKLCESSSSQVQAFFIQKLVELLSSILEESPHQTSSHATETSNVTASYQANCSDYFDLLSRLFSMTAHCSEVYLTINHTKSGVSELLESLTTFIRNHEVRESHEVSDVLLVHVLKLYLDILKFLPLKWASDIKRERSSMMIELFQTGLFSALISSSDDAEYPKLDDSFAPRFIHAKTRDVAFQLVQELCSNCLPNFTLLQSLIHHHHHFDVVKTTKFAEKKIVSIDNKTKMICRTPSILLDQPRSASNYVGLYNPGCVCYMNSILQQLFMIQSFREGIIQIEHDMTSLTDLEIANHTIYQLQLLFSYLKGSVKKCVDPRAFCVSFKDYDGQSTDIMVQHDANEFLTNFFQQVENFIMGSKSEALLKTVFGGISIF